VIGKEHLRRSASCYSGRGLDGVLHGEVVFGLKILASLFFTLLLFPHITHHNLVLISKRWAKVIITVFHAHLFLVIVRLRF
jgi:hypothetical protein